MKEKFKIIISNMDLNFKEVQFFELKMMLASNHMVIDNKIQLNLDAIKKLEDYEHSDIDFVVEFKFERLAMNLADISFITEKLNNNPTLKMYLEE